jgi:hypothetical protein
VVVPGRVGVQQANERGQVAAGNAAKSARTASTSVMVAVLAVGVLAVMDGSSLYRW